MDPTLPKKLSCGNWFGKRVDERQTCEEIRKLGTCCVRTMMQSADPNSGKQPFALFVANLFLRLAISVNAMQGTSERIPIP